MLMPLTTVELLIILSLVSFMGFECLLALRSKSWVEIYRPTLFVAVVLAFYALVGPFRAILAAGEPVNFVGTSGTLYRGLDHREFLVWGWLGALAFSFRFDWLLSFLSKSPPRRVVLSANLSTIRRAGVLLCIIGLLPYAWFRRKTRRSLNHLIQGISIHLVWH